MRFFEGVGVVRPRIAVVGSIDETRVFDPPVTDPVGARRACEKLGGELAGAGWDLVVYSGQSKFVEADVVRGYLGSGKAEAGSVEVRAPKDKTGFAEFSSHREVFDIRSDSSRDWEVSYYRSLAGVDGVLLVGGGRSTLVTGLIALTLRIPVIAAATFGGNAVKVWGHLDNEYRGHAAADAVDVAAMAAPWGDGSAKRLVGSLIAQRETQQRHIQENTAARRRESRRTNIGLAVISGLAVLVVAGLAVTWGWQLGTGLSIALLALLPTLAGAVGALVRTSLDRSQDWARAAVLGGAAGLITGLLYIASQLIGAPDVLDTSQSDSVRRLLFFVLPIGFVAGLTFDAVYGKLRGKDVSQADTLAAITTGPPK